MSPNVPQIEVHFVSLSPEQEDRYREVKRIINRIAQEPDGEMFILNAFALLSDTTLIEMDAWINELLSSGLQPRDIVGKINDQPLSMPSFIG